MSKHCHCGSAFTRHCMAKYKDRGKGKLHLILGNNHFFLAESKGLIVLNNSVKPKIFIILCKYMNNYTYILIL